ncbi:uncharacterized protein LOC135177421 isoform X2 [Pogoniulus pusillus]|uniref:uncharacterized protein LOC135177421 isoform X2 n=1 Tax=Pogoniulus pusillus TaxID=488313 RepID=UPI0030B930AB
MHRPGRRKDALRPRHSRPNFSNFPSRHRTKPGTGSTPARRPELASPPPAHSSGSRAQNRALERARRSRSPPEAAATKTRNRSPWPHMAANNPTPSAQPSFTFSVSPAAAGDSSTIVTDYSLPAVLVEQCGEQQVSWAMKAEETRHNTCDRRSCDGQQQTEKQAGVGGKLHLILLTCEK